MKFIITGGSGFLGSSLIERLDNDNKDFVSCSVDELKHGEFFLQGATHLVHFASPSSQILFAENRDCIKNTITDFIKIVEYCKDKRIKLIFPSSATTYTDGNAYSFTKLALEDIAKAYGVNHLALRISACYGPSEKHKGDYASVVYKWAWEMKHGISPIIYGNGQQTRDFIYIDDVLDTILSSLEEEGVLDIATGINTPFNRIIEALNLVLSTKITPTYIQKPQKYFDETVCPHPFKDFLTVEEGIKKLCNQLGY